MDNVIAIHGKGIAGSGAFSVFFARGADMESWILYTASRACGVCGARKTA